MPSIAIQSRSIVTSKTCRAEMLERRMLLTSFPGVSLQDEFDLLGGGPTTSPCPDTMGA